MRPQEEDYYTAHGCGTYYLCDIIVGVVREPGRFARKIEEIMGDAKTEWFTQPFKTYTNLHEFIREVALDLFSEGVSSDNGSPYLSEFLLRHELRVPDGVLDDEDAFWEFALESDDWDKAVDDHTEEVFHVLFRDVQFLADFNRLCAGYIETNGGGSPHAREDGKLDRVHIPTWARRAVFHRDQGECRHCKRNLTSIATTLDREQYDHIIPLARFGANDVTNLQLLCDECNRAKSAREVPVSRKLRRIIPPR